MGEAFSVGSILPSESVLAQRCHPIATLGVSSTLRCIDQTDRAERRAALQRSVDRLMATAALAAQAPLH